MNDVTKRVMKKRLDNDHNVIHTWREIERQPSPTPMVLKRERRQRVGKRHLRNVARQIIHLWKRSQFWAPTLPMVAWARKYLRDRRERLIVVEGNHLARGMKARADRELASA